MKAEHKRMLEIIAKKEDEKEAKGKEVSTLEGTVAELGRRVAALQEKIEKIGSSYVIGSSPTKQLEQIPVVSPKFFKEDNPALTKSVSV